MIFVAAGDVPALVAKGATRSIPIVFLTNSDRSGLASWTASIGRRQCHRRDYARRATGGEALQLLHALVPKTPLSACCSIPTIRIASPNGGCAIGRKNHRAANPYPEASNSEDIDKAFATLIELELVRCW